MDELLRGAAERVLRQARDPVPEPVAVTELPDKPLPDEDLLDLLTGIGRGPDPAAPAALAAHWLAGHGVPDAVTAAALGWLVDLLGLPSGTAGGVVADPAAATLAGLAAARHQVLADVGWDVEARGLTGAPPVTVVVGEAAHSGLFDALRLLGLGGERVVRVRTDGQGRMRPTLIPPLHPPAIVCTQVGEAASGAIDPVAAVCAEVHDADAWVHVDGSFGLWAAASPVTRDLLIGVAYADSWATAAPEVPYDGGLVFARDAGALRVALELVRPARGVEVWAALLALGRAGVAQLVEDACGQARRLAAELGAAGFPVLNEVVLDRVVVGAASAGTVWKRRPAVFLRAGREPDVEEVIRALMR